MPSFEETSEVFEFEAVQTESLALAPVAPVSVMPEIEACKFPWVPAAKILEYVAVAVLFVVNYAKVPVAPAANVPAVWTDSPSIIFVFVFIVSFFLF